MKLYDRIFIILFIVGIILYNCFNGYFQIKYLKEIVYFYPLIFCLINFKKIKKIKKSDMLIGISILIYPMISNFSYYLENIDEYIKFIYNICCICILPNMIVKGIEKKLAKKVIYIYKNSKNKYNFYNYSVHINFTRIGA